MNGDDRARGEGLWSLPGLDARWLGVALLAVFALDVFTPLGFAHGVLYLPVLMLGTSLRRPRTVLWLGLAAALLTVAGVPLSPPAPPGVAAQTVMANRLISLLLIGFTSVLAWRGAVARLRMIDARQRLDRQQRLLDIASTVGRLGGWTLELASGRVRWSDELARLHGKAPGFSPATVEEGLSFYTAPSRLRIQPAVERCLLDGAPFDMDLVIIDAQGVERAVRVVGRAVRDDTGRIVGAQGAFQDIAESHAAQQALQHSLARWHLLAESMPLIVWTADADGRVDYLNGSFGQFAGLSGAEALAAWNEVLHPDDRAGASESWRQARAQGQPWEFEMRLRRHDGVWRWHLARAVPLHGESQRIDRWYGSATDIDDVKRLQHEAQDSARRLTAALESMTDAAFMLDRDWRFTVVNRQCERLLQRNRSELLGQVVWELFPLAVGTRFQQEYEQAVAEGAMRRFESRYDPLNIDLEVSAYPFDGGLAVYFRDVTAHKELTQRMHQAQRLESLGELTGGVAHDFNNLLTVIMGNAELLAEGLPVGGAQQRLAQMVGTAAQRGAELTQRLLAFARKQALEPKVVDVNRLVNGTDGLLRRTLGEHIEIEWVRGAGLWPALVDPGQLENALLNLAINARDAMAAGGRLTIETANVRLDEAYAAQQTDLAAGPYVMVAVSDSGCGIPPESLARVFEPFFTTKATGKGTGLGLAMVYGFVKQSHGHVAIYSEPGRGTTVKLYLPRPGRGEQPEDVADATPVQGGRSELVLMVEDDALVREYACGQLQSLGYRVLEAADGPQAMVLLQHRPDVALLFTDVVMPGGMSGRDLADAARALRPTLPVLYTSGYTENAIVHHGRLDPGVLLLGKPYRRADLAHKVAEALASSTEVAR